MREEGPGAGSDLDRSIPPVERKVGRQIEGVGRGCRIAFETRIESRVPISDLERLFLRRAKRINCIASGTADHMQRKKLRHFAGSESECVQALQIDFFRENRFCRIRATASRTRPYVVLQ